MARPFAKTHQHALAPLITSEGLHRVNTHCSGPCQQGRLPCQTPEACERPLEPSLWQRIKAWLVAPGMQE